MKSVARLGLWGISMDRRHRRISAMNMKRPTALQTEKDESPWGNCFQYSKEKWFTLFSNECTPHTSPSAYTACRQGGGRQVLQSIVVEQSSYKWEYMFAEGMMYISVLKLQNTNQKQTSHQPKAGFEFHVTLTFEPWIWLATITATGVQYG